MTYILFDRNEDVVPLLRRHWVYFNKSLEKVLASFGVQIFPRKRESTR
jgi:hypothetical protein